MSARPDLQRLPYQGLWLDSFTLTGVAGGALVVGGQEWHAQGGGSTPMTVTSAMRWDAATDAWEVLAPMPQPRQGHAAVALPDGRVLIIGGRNTTELELASTLVWEPDTRRFRDGPPLLAARARPVAVALPDGAVLVLGSDFDEDMERGTRAELLRPGADAWELAGQTVRLFHPGPVCVSGERVIIAGGRDNGFGFAVVDGVHFAPPLDQCTEVWQRDTREWKTSHPLTESRDGHQGVTLSDGRILVMGGWRKGELLGSAEVWDPASEQWTPTGALAHPRSSFKLAALPDGRAAAFGGLGQNDAAASAAVDLWAPQTGAWTPGPRLAAPLSDHHVAALEDGAFLLVGLIRTGPEGMPQTTSIHWRP
ncbi:Kelch repeat-containing protein [Myxococcus sp. NMCA1]|uniref:Kelch repeat-containing protein n=1 Tax=Myxococcus sp. NMCA1 TaxID=2996785 RepID=UPI0022857134|nr:kelch repeat-containing protein [Myxococcus sp. NMCA1]WAM28744.1 kelch-like protein [Myxococcus sp. NMCA1]